MHFDEVYHARTAAEFLQDWRYGISHSIYEWTHPHLAKYLMAGGIVLFAGQDVQASSDLGVPVRDAAIEPRRADPAGSTVRTGDRAWVVTGSELIAYDLATRQVEARWSVPGARSVAFDATGIRVLVGTDAGEILTLDTSTLDATRGTSADQPSVDPTPVASVAGPVQRVVPYTDGSHAAVLLGGGEVVVVDLDTGQQTGTGHRGRRRRHRRGRPDRRDHRDAGAGDRPQGGCQGARDGAQREREGHRGTAPVDGPGHRGHRRQAHDRCADRSPGRDRRRPARRCGHRAGPHDGRRRLGRADVPVAPGVRAGDHRAAGRRLRPGPGERRGRGHPALRDHAGRQGPAGGRGGRRVRRLGQGRARDDHHVPAPGRRDQGAVRRGGPDGRGAGHDPGRQRHHRLRHRAARQERVRGPQALVRADRSGRRRQLPVPHVDPGRDPGLRPGRPGRLPRRGALRLRLAPAGSDPGGADRRRAVPAGARPVPAAVDRRAGRAVRAPGRDVLRPEPDRDERRLHRLLHPRRVPAVRLDLGGLESAPVGVLDADAGDRRAPRPRPRVEMGGGVRHRGTRNPRAHPVRAGAGSC